MEVTYDKTSHLIFPTAIRYVDLGSEYLIAGKAEDAENVLRVKSIGKEFWTGKRIFRYYQWWTFYNFNAL